jgi:protein-tyrosine phosphatase
MRLHENYIYDVPGILNIRDMGGYTAKDGRVTAKGRFIRSAGLSGSGEEGKSDLIELGVDCVIDLRSSTEREFLPDIAEEIPGIHYFHVPMLDYIASSFSTNNYHEFPSTMAELYASLLVNSRDGFRRVFEVFADIRYKRCLFHCTAGKDRTGVTAMLLLGLAGVDDKQIVADYTLTDELLSGTWLSRSAPGVPNYVLIAAEENMSFTLNFLRETYGDAASYLTEIGVSEASQERILKKLFD